MPGPAACRRRRGRTRAGDPPRQGEDQTDVRDPVESRACATFPHAWRKGAGRELPLRSEACGQDRRSLRRRFRATRVADSGQARAVLIRVLPCLRGHEVAVGGAQDPRRYYRCARGSNTGSCRRATTRPARAGHVAFPVGVIEGGANGVRRAGHEVTADPVGDPR